jgi:hypothetical protein
MRAALVCLGLLLTAACQSEAKVTEVLVVIDADDEVTAQLSRLQVAVYATDDLRVPERELPFLLTSATPSLTRSEDSLPLSFALLPDARDRQRAFRLVVTGFGPLFGQERELVEQQVVSAFVPNQVVRLDVLLTGACLQKLCRDPQGQRTEQTCQGATASCQPAAVQSALPRAEPGALGGYVSTVLDGGGPGVATVDRDASADTDARAGADGQANSQVERSCPAGFRGAQCEIDINECNEINLCKSNDYPCMQTTAPGYTCRGQLADWPMPDRSGGAAHAPSYDVTTTPGVVIDKVTGLMWQRERPLQYLGCSGMRELPYDICSWPEAVGYCDALSLAGHDDWRLPAKIELESILDLTLYQPNIDLTIFPGTRSDWYWTSSPYIDKPGLFWMVSFWFGADTQFPTSEKQYVRCVR